MNSLIFAAIAPWISASFPIIRMVLIILMVVLSLLTIVAILLQPAQSKGMGAISGEGDTYFSKNKSRTLEGTAKKLTIIFGVCLIVVSILFFSTILIYNGTI